MQSLAFIDWPRGAAAEPSKGLQTYEVKFFCSVPQQKATRLAYVVSYEFDVGEGPGYVYLPGRGDEHYEMNVASIFHGVEGHWFYASGAWERLVKPLIEKAVNAPAA